MTDITLKQHRALHAQIKSQRAAINQRALGLEPDLLCDEDGRPWRATPGVSVFANGNQDWEITQSGVIQRGVWK